MTILKRFRIVLFGWTILVTGVTTNSGPPPTRTYTIQVIDNGVPGATSTITLPATFSNDQVRASLRHQGWSLKHAPSTPPPGPVTPGTILSGE